MDINDITESVIGAAITVHRELGGPGLLESHYKWCLQEELTQRGHAVRREVTVPLVYKGRKLDGGYRIDMLVDDRVVVEPKVVEKVAPVHRSRVLTYLRLSGKTVGLLINFNVPVLKDGVKRIVLGYEGPPPRGGPNGRRAG